MRPPNQTPPLALGANITMPRVIYAIRLIAACGAVTVSALFVRIFSTWSAFAHKYAHPDQSVTYTAINEILLSSSHFAFFLPVAILGFGAAMLKLKPGRLLIVELLIQASWLFGLSCRFLPFSHGRAKKFL